MMLDIGKFLSDSKRVLLIARKPGWDEFKTMAKITGLGIIVIGAIGFFVLLFFTLIGLK